MTFWEEVQQFADGAWESVRTGVNEGFRDFIGGMRSDEQGNPVQTTAQPTTNTSAATSSRPPSAGGLFGLSDKQVMLIGGGVLAIALLIAVRK